MRFNITEGVVMMAARISRMVIGLGGLILVFGCADSGPAKVSPTLKSECNLESAKRKIGEVGSSLPQDIRARHSLALAYLIYNGEAEKSCALERDLNVLDESEIQNEL